MNRHPQARLRRIALTLPATAALALVVLVGASAQPPTSSPYGGWLVVGMSAGAVDSLDPTLSRNIPVTGQIFAAMCQQLYGTNSKLQPVPVLAARLPVLSKDKLSYTVELKQGVRFNDGTPFNAQAVVAAVQRMITFPGSIQSSRYASVEKVSASGPHTVVFRLKNRDSTFLANAYSLSPTQLAKLGDAFATNPVCVGPFMFAHQAVGDHVTLVKSPYYYDQGSVYLDRIVFKPMPDATAAATALKAGDIQALDRVSTTELRAVRQSPNLRVIQGFELGWSGVQINIGNRSGIGSLPYAKVDTALASNAKLRQAFEEAIDRNTLNRVVFDGLYQVTCTPIAPANTIWYESTKVPCAPYDPKHARRLVAESGVSNPTVRLLTSNRTDALRAAQFIKAQEAAVGINVVIDAIDSASTVSRRLSGNFDVMLGGFSPGGVDPTLTIRLATSNPANYSGYSNPRLDLILANGLEATDSKARANHYRTAQQIILQDRPYIPLYNRATFAAFSTDVVGVELTATGVMNVAKARYR